MKKIMSIDASTTSTGIAIFENNKLIKYQCITEDSNKNVLTRILKMTSKIRKIYIQFQPDQIIMEEVLPEDVKHNQKVFKALIYLQASIILMFYEFKKPVELIVASHWRKICGIKTGSKIKREQLKIASQKLVKNIFKIDINNDISDAICIGIAYIIQNKQKSAF